MDEIQKVLIKAGRKDLAQKYYKKTAKKPSFMKAWDEMSKREKTKAMKDAATEGFMETLIEHFDMKEKKFIGRMDDALNSHIMDIDPQEVNQNDLRNWYSKLRSAVEKQVYKVKL